MDNIKLLKKLGMTEYEARAYLSLARLGPSTVREIVVESNLPRNKAYEALESLERVNKVISLPLSPRKYRIFDPGQFREEVEDISKSFDSLVKLIEQPKQQEFRDLFWILKGKKAILEKLSAHSEKARKEVLSCNRLSRPFFKNIRTMKEAVDRGVKVKMICTFDRKNIYSYVEWMKTGAKIRVFNHDKFGPLLPRITIFDGKIARLTIGRPEVKNDEDYITLWTESKAFAQMLRNHFIIMWKDSKPIEKYI